MFICCKKNEMDAPPRDKGPKMQFQDEAQNYVT